MTGSEQQDGNVSAQGAALAIPVPRNVWFYLAHIGGGLTIRTMARLARCHASTLSRRVRRVEQLRDDPLYDAALRRLEAGMGRGDVDFRQRMKKELKVMASMDGTGGMSPKDSARFEKEATRVLRRLCEKGAILAIARDMDMAVVVRDEPGGTTTRTAVVDQQIAEGMVLKGWIEGEGKGRIIRYSITPAGREAVKGLLAQHQPASPAMAEAPAGFDHADANGAWAHRSVPDGEGGVRKLRYSLADSPLTALARRRDKDGRPFLSEAMVRAGERLREDFELAQMEPRVAQDWDRMLTAGVDDGAAAQTKGFGPEAARARVQAALTALGEGLSDVALRCCCYLEGLESAEQRMGWSARSGKIVLRIALGQLARHYQETRTPENDMIG